jgi:VanZ family protein
MLVLYMGKRASKLYAIMFVFLYACSDEIHQHFVDGRVAAFKDVLIDTAGGICSCLIVSIMDRIKNDR